jgi:geranylgeranyl diphosphate synthase type I
MLNKIKNNVEEALATYLHELDVRGALGGISDYTSDAIRDFILRKGKRIRPTLFVISYCGFAKKVARGLYKSAVSLELLHNFILVHDDIIDDSDLRRGQPAMHKLLDAVGANGNGAAECGKNLALIVGDMMYAMAINAFLSIREKRERKEKALIELTEAAFRTGSGQFIEQRNKVRDMGEAKKQDVYMVYDLKTAHYTFCAPLTAGALLAGAGQREINKLHRYGIAMGRAFQIKDDILGLFGDEKDIGKSPLSDLKESKRTILLWHSYRNTTPRNRAFIKRLLVQDEVGWEDLEKMRAIATAAGTRDYARAEIASLTAAAERIRKTSAMRPVYKDLLKSYTTQLLNV